MIDVAAPSQRERLEAAVRVTRKAGHDVAVVHAPAVDTLEVHPDVAARERRRRTHLLVARRVGVVVVDAEQERVERLPLKAEGEDFQNGVAGHGHGVWGYSPIRKGRTRAFGRAPLVYCAAPWLLPAC